MKPILLSVCLFALSHFLRGQDLVKLSNGIQIKGEKYFDTEYKILYQTFHIDTITIEIGQIFRNEIDYKQFYCRAIIHTRTENNIIDELYYENIEAVGGYFGICFDEIQLKNNYVIGSKYGDYSGRIILINSN